jgi:hypothetical protein
MISKEKKMKKKVAKRKRMSWHEISKKAKRQRKRKRMAASKYQLKSSVKIMASSAVISARIGAARRTANFLGI